MVRQGLRPLAFACFACLGACTAPARSPAASDEPPAAPRELRAAWVATVANIDWPSQKGLPAAQQHAELLAILDRARDLKLNALVVQVRSCADAIYPSQLEPWSEFLTGEQGKAPDPPYDPLAVWVDEGHRRGIEIHAWFNPYRARHPESKTPNAPTHIASTHPSTVKEYGAFQWMDPGEEAAAQRTLDVILDVVRRYDVDGVHIDDYFYPYPEKTPAGDEVPFPDDGPWDAYQRSGGKLDRADWRRKNVSDLIERIHQGVHREKPFVKFGISPFGLGRPDRRPNGIPGFSQYDKLYADVELWLDRGWLDYLAPQLYWKIDSKQAFEPLFDYWNGASTQKRHVFPGLYTSQINDTPRSWAPEEILNQVNIVRSRSAAAGEIHFSMVSLLQNRKGIADRLKAGAYVTRALPPSMPWLDATLPPAPGVDVQERGGRLHVQAAPAAGKAISRFAIWTRHGGEWSFDVVPASAPELEIDRATRAGRLEAVVVSAIDRVGNESARTHATLPTTYATPATRTR